MPSHQSAKPPRGFWSLARLNQIAVIAVCELLSVLFVFFAQGGFGAYVLTSTLVGLVVGFLCRPKS